MRVNALELIARHYEVGSTAHRILVVHSILVGRKAMELAEHYENSKPGSTVDKGFLEEICLLHDIGIGKTKAAGIGCHGDAPYICHGVLGREILEGEGLPRHALACERHTGSGITTAEVREQALPIPERDYLPQSLEEKILCVADKFYGKKPSRLWLPKAEADIARGMAKHGDASLERWNSLWAEICE